MALWQWSTIPASNASAGAIDWAEGQPPSTVNDSARQMMADVAVWFAGPEWLNYGLTPTYVSGTQFTLAGNQTGIYSVGRRVRATVTAGTVYGRVTGSVFASLTTVTVLLDSGALDSGVSEVDVGILSPSNPSVPVLPNLVLKAVNGDQGTLTIDGSADTSYGASIALLGNGATTPYKYLRALNGSLSVVNSAYTQQILSLDDSGNLVANGNITSSSDERLKTDWADLPSDFIDCLAAVKNGTYARIDINQRHVGVGAQSLRPLMPEAVIEGGNGILSVAYGQAALAACVELAKEVVRLRALLEPVK